MRRYSRIQSFTHVQSHTLTRVLTCRNIHAVSQVFYDIAAHTYRIRSSWPSWWRTSRKCIKMADLESWSMTRMRRSQKRPLGPKHQQRGSNQLHNNSSGGARQRCKYQGRLRRETVCMKDGEGEGLKPATHAQQQQRGTS